MNKSLKKTLVLTLCVVLCIFNTFACFAELIPLKPADSAVGKITVKLESDAGETTTGMRATAYRIIKVNVDNVSEAGQDEVYQPKEPVYYWAPGVAQWVAAQEKYKGYIDTTNGNAVTDAYIQFVKDENAPSDDPEYIGFIDELTAAIRNNLILADKGGVEGINFKIEDGQYVLGGGKDADDKEIPLVQTAAFAGDTATVSNLSKGSYIVLIENGRRIYQPAVANLTPVYYSEYNGTDTGFDGPGWYVTSPAPLTIKAKDVSLTKTVSTKATVPGGDAVTSAMTQTVYFTIFADVPQYSAAAISETFGITDRLSKGLTLKADTIEVYGVNADKSEKLLTNKTEYDYSALTLTEEQKPTYSGGFLVNFQPYYDDVSVYSKVKIFYEATVNNSAVLGSAGNPNEVELAYANNPYMDKSVKTIDDDAVVYTYGFKLTKTNETEEIRLPGAVFTVEKLAEDGKSWGKVHFSAGSNGVYEHNLSGTQDRVETGNTVGEEDAKDDSMLGILMLKGLDVGTYRITEVQAPAGGYVLLKNPIEFYIVDEISMVDANKVEVPDGILETVTNGVGTKTNRTDADGIAGYVTRLVKNSTGFDLPLTGGMGTILFTVGGAALIVGAVVLLLVANRKKSRCN